MEQETIQLTNSEAQEALEKIYLTCDTIDFSIIREGQIKWAKKQDSYNNHELRLYTLQALQEGNILIGDKRGY